MTRSAVDAKKAKRVRRAVVARTDADELREGFNQLAISYETCSGYGDPEFIRVMRGVAKTIREVLAKHPKK